MRTEIARHIFNQPNDRDFRGVKKANGAGGINQRQILRCGNDHGTDGLVFLDHRKLDVAGARRHIDHDVAHIAPFGVDKLRQGIARHGATPRNGLARIDQLAHRQERHAASTHYRYHILAFGLRLHAFNTHQPRL